MIPEEIFKRLSPDEQQALVLNVWFYSGVTKREGVGLAQADIAEAEFSTHVDEALQGCGVLFAYQGGDPDQAK